MGQIKDTQLLVLDWTLGSSPPLPAQSRTRHLWLFIYFAEWAVAAAAASPVSTGGLLEDTRPGPHHPLKLAVAAAAPSAVKSP